MSVPSVKKTRKLHIDHIGGYNGKEKYRTGHALWRWLKKNNFPKGFRVFCYSCNILDGLFRNYSTLGIKSIDDLAKLVKG